MENAVLPDSTGRASVEAPLHSTLSARYVVHTHPTLVNGMTCARDGKAKCRTLFPDALWLDFIDPGFTLCIKVRQEILKYTQAHGREPALIFLKNHGVFVAGDSPAAIQSLYAHIFETLQAQYDKAGIVTHMAVEPCAEADSVEQSLRSELGWGSDVRMAVSALFQTPQEAAKQAVENDVHILGVSSLAAGHKTLIPQVIDELKKYGRDDIMVIVGGVIPKQDYQFLFDAGALAVFGPGTKISDAAIKILEILID